MNENKCSLVVSVNTETNEFELRELFGSSRIILTE